MSVRATVPRERVKVSHVIVECRVINHHPIMYSKNAVLTMCNMFVYSYKIPYRRALGLAAFKPSAQARANLYYIQAFCPQCTMNTCMQDAFARARTRPKGTWPMQPLGQARATIGYLVNKMNTISV